MDGGTGNGLLDRGKVRIGVVDCTEKGSWLVEQERQVDMPLDF
jgi:hypothetical protein